MKGIYCIRNIINNKRYVGSSVNIAARKRTHFYQLRNNKYKGTHFQNSFNKYGEDSFEFEILEIIDVAENIKDILQEREQYWCDVYYPELYNIRPIAKSNLGFRHTPEAIEKIREANKKKTISQDFRNKMSAIVTGRILTQEHKNNISKSKGMPVIQININTNQAIKVWNSMMEAEKSLGIPRTNISSVCRGINKTAGGYKWEYFNV